MAQASDTLLRLSMEFGGNPPFIVPIRFASTEEPGARTVPAVGDRGRS